jgi:hypothetical protein
MIRTKRNKFGRLIIWILAMSILYTGCGADGSRLLTSRKVSDRDITSVAKDRKAPSGGKSRTREADDAAIFA